jgi:Tfp pilus assembly protein PilX
MDGGWILIGVVVWVLVALFVVVLMRMAADQDRVARRTEQRLLSTKDLSPYCDVTITQM